MAGKELDIVAIISPKIGKVDRVSWSPTLCSHSEKRPTHEDGKVAELLTNLTKAVHKNEPGCLRYHLHREINSKDGSEDLVMIERYTGTSAPALLTKPAIFFWLCCFSLSVRLVHIEPVLTCYSDMPINPHTNRTRRLPISRTW